MISRVEMILSWWSNFSLLCTSANKMTKNFTLNLISLLYRECLGINRSFHINRVDESVTTTEKPVNSEDKGAVMYIIVVLVFYSMGIVIMIITYLKTERQELEEEAALTNFFKGMSMVRKANNESHVNRVAIHAFHTLTTVNAKAKITKPKVLMTEV